jgi:SAM-dependent methyltransferase
MGLEEAIDCPACGGFEAVVTGRHSATTAAQHFVPRQRDPRRHEALVRHLHDLWGQDYVLLDSCRLCGFGYAVPWVGGDARFYALAHAGDPHYPANRWEFGQTLAALERPEFRRPLRLLEIGAGHGAFLDRVRRLGPLEITAADFDEGAVRRLREKGYEATVGSLSDVSTTGFEVVCLFQTLEHMAALDEVFAELRRVLAPEGSVFLSVPSSEAVAFQERVTGYWDMPPNHVSRWNPTAIRRASERRGFTVVAVECEPLKIPQVAWQLAVLSVNERSAATGTVENRINAIKHRPTRGVLKRVMAGAHLGPLLKLRDQFRPLTLWAHLRLDKPAAPVLTTGAVAEGEDHPCRHP